jgi:hypothetical protein
MMIKVVTSLRYFAMMLVLWGCSSVLEKDTAEYADLISTFDFESSDQLWDGGISDYPLDYEDSTEFVVVNQQLNYSSSVYDGNGMTISAYNPHGDLFYYFKRKVTGLRASTEYNVDFDFLVFSKIDSANVDPSQDIFLKVGAVNFEPRIIEIKSGESQVYLSLNVDKGPDNGDSGSEMINVGSIKEFTSVEAEAISGNTFDEDIRVQSDATGAIWLLIGVDSGLESELTFSLAAITAYYSEILG